MGQQGRRDTLARRRHVADDRVVIVCGANGRLVALVQALGTGPARLLTEDGETPLKSAPNGMTVSCWCAAGRHAIDVYRLQAEVFRQTNDPGLPRPLHITL